VKKLLAYLAAGLLALVVQALWRTVFHAGSGPEFLFLLVIFSGIHHRLFGGLLLAFVFGYIVDALWGLMPGLFAVLYAATFAACRLIGRRFYQRSFAFQLFIVGAATLALKIVESVVVTWVEARADSPLTMLWQAWPAVFWNLALAAPAMVAYERLEKSFADEYASQFLVRRGIL
jgi:rod shape-determining protein MreD